MEENLVSTLNMDFTVGLGPCKFAWLMIDPYEEAFRRAVRIKFICWFDVNVYKNYFLRGIIIVLYCIVIETHLFQSFRPNDFTIIYIVG